MEVQCSKVEPLMTTGQKLLAKKHGTPAEFARDVYKCVPGEISMNEARKAIESYNLEWDAAKRII